MLDKTLVKEFNYPYSCIAVNEGNGNFTIQKMPSAVQLSSLNAVIITDINKDNYPDLVLSGNNYGFQPQLGRLDASFGQILINNRKGGFDVAGTAVSGLQLNGEIKNIVDFQGISNRYILFLRNNDYPALFRVNKF